MSLTTNIISLLTLLWRCHVIVSVDLSQGMLFPRETETRQVKSLDGMWDFRADISFVGFEEMWYSLPLSQVNFLHWWIILCWFHPYFKPHWGSSQRKRWGCLIGFRAWKRPWTCSNRLVHLRNVYIGVHDIANSNWQERMELDFICRCKCVCSLWTGSLFGERVKKIALSPNRGPAHKLVRLWKKVLGLRLVFLLKGPLITGAHL